MSDSERPNIAFAKAAFAFKDGLEKARMTPKKSQVQTTVKTVEVPPPDVPKDPVKEAQDAAEAAHQARHKKRLRVARLVQHFLTSILSIAIAILQGKVYVIYQQTKDMPGCWPVNPNLVPTLILFVTALLAFAIDGCAILAYFFPKTNIGKRAFAIANSTYHVYTTVKGVSYAYSAIVCKAGFDQGNSNGANNDLWSWSCSQKGLAMSNITQAHSNCIGSTVAWIFAMANIGIEILGVIIDQVAKQDADKFKSLGSSATGMPSDSEKQDSTDPDSDTKPLLSSSTDAPASAGDQAKSQPKPTDDSSSQFDQFSDELDGDLTSKLPTFPKLQS